MKVNFIFRFFFVVWLSYTSLRIKSIIYFNFEFHINKIIDWSDRSIFHWIDSQSSFFTTSTFGFSFSFFYFYITYIKVFFIYSLFFLNSFINFSLFLITYYLWRVKMSLYSTLLNKILPKLVMLVSYSSTSKIYSPSEFFLNLLGKIRNNLWLSGVPPKFPRCYYFASSAFDKDWTNF